MADSATQPASNRLYCAICDKLLQKAIILPCCSTPCCEVCAGAGDKCPACKADKPNVLRHDPALRRVADSVPSKCPNVGCQAIMIYAELSTHREAVCRFEEVSCVFADQGCTVREQRQHIRDHQSNSCPYRMISCPQYCGLSIPAAEAGTHVDTDCPKTLVPCPNRCGQEVQRGTLGEHESVCPVRPRSCPYRPYGCETHGPMSDGQLQNHMSVSIHAHLQLLDSYLHTLPQVGGTPVVSRFDWDPSYVQNVGKWPAQANTINAVALLGPTWLVSGCERGSLWVFDRNTGEVVKRIAEAGVSPVRSLVGTADGRLFAGFGDCSVQTWMSDFERNDPLTVRVNIQMLTPTNRHLSKGITHMHIAQLPRTVLASRPSMLLPEGSQARSLIGAPSLVGGHVHKFEAAVCLIGDQVIVLEASMLQIVATVPLFKPEELRAKVQDATDEETTVLTERKTGMCLSSTEGALLWVGCSDGSIRIIDIMVLCDAPSEPTKALTVVTPSAFPASSEGATAIALITPRVGKPVQVAVGGSKGSISIYCAGADGTYAASRVLPNAHKSSVLCLTQIDGRHFASGGSDECWRLWGPPAAADDDMVIPAVELPSSMYTCLVAAGILYAAGGQGVIKEWTATTLRYVRR